MGCMHLLRVSGWVAAIVAAPAVLIVGVVAAHRASAPSMQRVGADWTAPAVNPHSASVGTDAGGQSLSAGVAIDPAYFSPGACVAFPPMMGNRHLTVFLDAGHGGLDPGAVGITPADLAYGHLLLLGPAKQGYFSTPSTMPGALVEPLFITDPFEGTIAASIRGQQVIAAGLARAIEQYFAPQPAP